jgi:hypothetical protein
MRVLWWLLLSSSATVLAQEETPDFVFDVALDEDAAPFVLVGFDVPAGTAEVEVRHESVFDVDVVDFGVEDRDGFRGWGGGNVEPAVIGLRAASRSYHPGPMPEGTWHVVIGKAQLVSDAPGAHIEIFLRTTATLPDASDRAPYVPATLSTGPRFYAGDLHVHSEDSGDARPGLDEIADFARGRGLDFVVVSDHNTDSQVEKLTPAQARHPDLLLVPGVEFTTYGGHATGFGVTRYVDHKVGLTTTVGEAAAAIQAQGGLFSINHPVLDLGTICIGCAWVNDVPGRVDGVEVATGGYDEVGFIFDEGARDFWDALLDDGSHAAPVGGSDDHKAGVDEGPFGSSIGAPTTMIFADALSVAALTQGIEDNRVVVKLQGPDDAMIDLQTDPPRSGDSVVFDGDVTLTAVITGGTGLSARFMKHGFEDGDVVEVDSDPFTLTRVVQAPDQGEERWRVELLEGRDGANEGHVAVLTGHVWLRRPPPSLPDDCGCGPGAAALLPLLLLLRRRRRRRR